MIKRTDEIAPRDIVEQARQHIRSNLGGDLRPASIARAIGVGVEDLKGSYRCTTTTSIRKDVKVIRLHALYEAVRLEPFEPETKQLQRLGLKQSDQLMDDFEQEFWISLEDHRRHSRFHIGKRPNPARQPPQEDIKA